MSKLAPEVGDVFNIIFPEYTVLAVVIEDTERETRIFRKYKYDGIGVPVIKAIGDRLLYQDKKVSLDKIVDQKKLNFDFVAWFNR